MRTDRSVSSALLSVVLLAGICSHAQAQQGLVLGLRGGVSVAGLASDIAGTLDESNRTGIAGGVFLDYDARILGFQVGAQYSQKGADLNIAGVVNEFSLTYLEIPVVLKLGIPLGALKPSVLGGAGFGFNTACDNSGADCGNDVTGTEVAGIAGADLAVYLGSVSLWADGRYYFGFNNINDASDVVGDLKNRNWTFQAGIGFKLGG